MSVAARSLFPRTGSPRRLAAGASLLGLWLAGCGGGSGGGSFQLVLAEAGRHVVVAATTIQSPPGSLPPGDHVVAPSVVDRLVLQGGAVVHSLTFPSGSFTPGGRPNLLPLFPTTAASLLPRNASLLLTFNEAVDASSVNAQSLPVESVSFPPIPIAGTYLVDGRQVIFDPTGTVTGFPPNGLIRVRLRGAGANRILSTSGRPLLTDSTGELVLRLTVQSSLDPYHGYLQDDQPPEVLAYSSVGISGESLISPDPAVGPFAPKVKFFFRFNEPMDPTSLSAFTNVRVLTPTGNVVIGKVLPVGGTGFRDYFFEPNEVFGYGPAGCASLGDPSLFQVFFVGDDPATTGNVEGLRDLAGNGLVAPLVPQGIHAVSQGFCVVGDPAAPIAGLMLQRFDSVTPTHPPIVSGLPSDLPNGLPPFYSPGPPTFNPLSLYTGDIDQSIFAESQTILRGRPISTRTVFVDEDHPIADAPGGFGPFQQGIQTPLSPYGARFLHVYRAEDIGATGRTEAIVGAGFSPNPSTVITDVYPQTGLQLGLSDVRPDMSLNSGNTPLNGQSGLGPFASQNYLTGTTPTRVVPFPTELVISPQSVQNPPGSKIAYHDWPPFQSAAIYDGVSSLLLDIAVQGFLPPVSIGANGFTVSLPIGAACPFWRAFCAGTANQIVSAVAPDGPFSFDDLRIIPGQTPCQNILGQSCGPDAPQANCNWVGGQYPQGVKPAGCWGDSTAYWLKLDLTRFHSEIVSPYFDLFAFLPPGLTAPLVVDYEEPVLIPDPSSFQTGSIRIEYRASQIGPSYDASGQIVDPPDVEPDGSDFRSDLNFWDGFRFLQFRLLIDGDLQSGEVPFLDDLVIPFREKE